MLAVWGSASSLPAGWGCFAFPVNITWTFYEIVLHYKEKSWWQYLQWVEKALSGYLMHELHCKKFCKECVSPRVWLISLCWLPADTSLISAGYVVQIKKKKPSYRFSIWLVYLFCSRCFQPVGRVNFQLPSPAHSVFHASALGHCAQACDAAKGEKKRYSRRQVRCSFNLKLKAFSQLVSN